jgi:hypothetical protein
MNEYLLAIPLVVIIVWLGMIFPFISKFNKKLYYPYYITATLWIFFMFVENAMLFQVTNFVFGTIVISFLILGLKKIKIISNIWFYFTYFIHFILTGLYNLSYIIFFEKGHLLPEYLNFDENPVYQFLNSKPILIVLAISVVLYSIPAFYIMRKLSKNSKSIDFSTYL